MIYGHTLPKDLIITGFWLATWVSIWKRKHALAAIFLLATATYILTMISDKIN